MSTEVVKDEPSQPTAASAPRQGPVAETLPKWKLNLTITVCLVLCLLSGYDVSNTANIQAPVYEALGHIEYLSWIGMGYSAGVTAVMPFYGRLSYIVDMKVLMLVAIVIFGVGTAVAGSATSLQALIVGRVLNGVGGAGTTQMVFAYITMLTGPAAPTFISLLGMCFALGLIAGPLVGGALANAPHATWRWAIYIVLPFIGMAIPIVLLYFPSRIARKGAFFAELARIDWIGAVLHCGTIMLLYLALTFSGPVYAWNSGGAIALWVIWGVVFVAYAVQQTLCLFTDRTRRILPVELLVHRVVGICTLGTVCAGVAYATALYYLPLFYAFTRGFSPIDSAVRLLPFICVFIAFIIAGGQLLPRIKLYVLFYAVAGPLILLGGALLATQVSPTTSVGTIMGLSVLLGAGVGLIYHHGLSISNAVLPPELKLSCSMLGGMAQTAGASLGLAISGCIYQNTGFNLLRDAMEPFGYSDMEIREALAGLKSSVWTDGTAEVKALALQAVTQGMDRVFYLIVGAGVVCCVGALALKWEKLDFQGPKPAQKPKVVESVTPGNGDATPRNDSQRDLEKNQQNQDQE